MLTSKTCVVALPKQYLILFYFLPFVILSGYDTSELSWLGFGIFNQNLGYPNKMVGQFAYLQLSYHCNAAILSEVNREERLLRHVAIIAKFLDDN